METDLFLWPDWRGILGKYDCTTELNFYLWNAPSPPAPVIITPPALFDPVVMGAPGGPVDPTDPPGDGADGPPTGPVDPGALDVAMLLLGFASLGYAAFRRSKAWIPTVA